MFDIHVHSRFSCDSKSEMKDCIIAAAEKGLDGICITDHAEFNPTDEGYNFYNEEEYFIEFNENKKTAPIKLLSGCEIGGGPHVYPEDFERYINKPYDAVLVSVHNWYGDTFASEMAKHPIPIEESYELYWNEVLNSVLHGGFDILAHIDFPKRYYKRLLYDEKVLRLIFEIIIKKNIALEINTSTLKDLGEAMPGPDILNIYKDCGGRYVSLGSDAHIISSIGEGFETIKPLLDGLTTVYFEKRKLIEYDYNY